LQISAQLGNAEGRSQISVQLGNAEGVRHFSPVGNAEGVC
jgi:hypothetical protein